jgi:hypothetical protein
MKTHNRIIVDRFVSNSNKTLDDIIDIEGSLHLHKHTDDVYSLNFTFKDHKYVDITQHSSYLPKYGSTVGLTMMPYIEGTENEDGTLKDEYWDHPDYWLIQLEIVEDDLPWKHTEMIITPLKWDYQITLINQQLIYPFEEKTDCPIELIEVE